MMMRNGLKIIFSVYGFVTLQSITFTLILHNAMRRASNIEHDLRDFKIFFSYFKLHTKYIKDHTMGVNTINNAGS